jgi:hypothetical protein
MRGRWVCLMLGWIALGASSGLGAQLGHRWSFNGDLKDSIGGQDAMIVPLGASKAILSSTEVTMTGGAKATADYVDLPDHALSKLGSSVTMEIWATPLSIQNWARIFEFGSGQAEHTCMSWCTGTNINTDHVEYFSPADNSRVDNTNAPYELGVKYHIVVVWEPGSETWYTAKADSPFLGAAKGSYSVVDVSKLDDIDLWIGRSHYDDGTANASYDEIRFWAGALSEADREKLHALGPDQVGGGVAVGPRPRGTDVPRDTVLSWTPGEFGKTHDVYLGTGFDSVQNAGRTSPSGVLVSQNQDANTYDPAGSLAFGQTYYWRIDEVNGAPDFSIYTGTLWSFTVETYGYPVKPVKATASSQSNSLMGPEKTIDGSGMDSSDQHSTSASHMWLSKKNTTPIWIKYDFDQVYKFHEMWVWNSNQATEPDVGLGAKDVTVETSTDGTTWTPLAAGPVEFSQAPGGATYTHNTTVDLAGVQAQYVRLTVGSNWADTTKQAGLSEVRFFYVPVKAFGAAPATGATGVTIDSVLNWRPGREAVQHQVYLGTDPSALPLAETQTGHSLALASLGLQYGQTYYWKVNEVNDAANPPAWEGDLWSFTTPDYGVVDDFEKYNDKCNRIFFGWVDGFGYSASADCAMEASGGNGTGSTVGNASAPFAEKTLIHGGKQSMPLAYDNTTGKSVSEATRTFAVAQDWTLGGAKTLVLYFRGSPDNGAGQLYVVINGTKIQYSGPATALTTAVWKQWNIDLAAVGANLKAVKTLSIGVSGAGKGMLYVDDILLYRAVPSVVVPADPGKNNLMAYYAMEGDLKDVSGHGYDGTVQGGPSFVDSLAGYGKAIQLGGNDDYAEVPIGKLVKTLKDTTITSWVNFSHQGGGWQRIFDFGNSSSAGYMLLCPSGQGLLNAPLWFAITKTGNAAGQESVVQSAAALSSGWHCVAVVINSSTMRVRLYVDGDFAGEGATAALPADLGETKQNWMGRSQYATDAYYNGLIDDFRIYNRVLSDGEIRYLAGDR